MTDSKLSALQAIRAELLAKQVDGQWPGADESVARCIALIDRQIEEENSK